MPKIGLGSTLEIDDAGTGQTAAGAFTIVPNVLMLGIPEDGTFQLLDSKRLDVSGLGIPRIPGMKTFGEFTVKCEFDEVQYARLEGCKGKIKNFKIRINGNVAVMGSSLVWVRTVPGVITMNKIDDVEADAIETFTITVAVTGQGG